MSFVRRALLGSTLVMALAACSGTPATQSAVPAGASATAAATTSATTSATLPRPSATAIPSAGPTLSAAGLPVFSATEPLFLFAKLTGAGGGIFVMHPDGTGKTQLATDVLPGVHKRASWSPDGQDVLFVDETTERLWIAHLDGRPTTAVATCMNHGCDFPAWSPDGRKIAYSLVESKDGVVGPASVGIEVIDLASGTVSKVVRFSRPNLADSPSWSADGTEIAFQAEHMDDEAFDTGAALAVVPVAGGKVRYLTDFDVFATTPDWSWATGEIVFATDLLGAQKTLGADQQTWDLWGLKPDGSGLHRFTHLAAGERLRSPKWSPDGRQIFAFDDVNELAVTVDPATGSVTPLPTGANGYRPTLRPLATS